MSAPAVAPTPSPPYYAVIFTSLRTEGDQGYGDMAERMVELAHEQPGFLGVESARGAGGFGITVSYWESTQAIANWKANAEHRIAQETGKTKWYADYQLRVARVERAYGKTHRSNTFHENDPHQGLSEIGISNSEGKSEILPPPSDRNAGRSGRM